MSRPVAVRSALAAASLVTLTALALVGCTSMPPATPPTVAPTGAAGGGTVGANVKLPTCDEITTAIGALPGDLVFNAEASATQTAPEDYDQRVCVYLSADTLTQLGITVAAIPFQQTEIDGYAALPNAIADDRLTEYQGVLQTLGTGDADDGHLDSPLYLFDTTYSITVQAVSTGQPVSDVLPNLSVEVATDGAFAVRALLG